MDQIDLTKKGMTVDKAYRDQRDKGCYDGVFENYKDPATRYAFAVLEGNIVAGQMIKLDSLRHLQDLRRIAEDDSFQYVYDLDKCRAILNFSKLVPDVSTGKPLPLMLWQQKIICSCQGWRDKKGEKRFSRVLFSVARTNGKTYLSNILLAYAFIIEASGLYNQDMAYIAPITDQSKKGFSYITTTFNALAEIPAFKKEFNRLGIDPLHDLVISRKRQNKLSRNSHESGKFDSHHYLLAVADEQGDDKRIGKIKENNGKITSGQVQTANHQFFQISTAYPDSNSYFYHDERMIEEVMQQDYDRTLDDYLCMVWEQDELSETDDPDLWIKSNPILGLDEEKHDLMLKSMLSERDTFVAEGKLPEFQNKNLNMWLQVKVNSYLELDDINNAVVTEPPFDIKGHSVYVGFDKSNFSDDTAISFIFPYTDNSGKNKWYIYQHSWIPLARAQNNINIKEKEDGISYRQAEKMGYADITKNQFGYIDDESVFNWLLGFVESNELKIIYFCYDRWGTSKIIPWIEQKTEWATMPVKNVIQSLNEPTIDFRKRMASGEITYLNDPIIKYSLKNAVLFMNNNGMKIDKEKQTSKIDFVDATMDAFFAAMYHFDDISLEKEDVKNPFHGMSNDDINDYFTNDFSF